jgi:phosphatidylserine/phosphatidylglycerophosphate/cardiolipin synthase-like enzyme
MIVDEIFELLGGREGEGCGKTYGLSDTNKIEKILDTPQLWGTDPSKCGSGPHGQNLTGAIRDLIGSAKHTVDISTLTPFPDGVFLEALRDGIRKAAYGGRRIAVRALKGVFPGEAPVLSPEADMARFLEELDAPANVPVYVGAMQSGLLSWNHSKLVIVDGRRAICGGHNMWTKTYCAFAPVHDISIQLSGPAVAVAQEFLNMQWRKIAVYSSAADPLYRYWSIMRLNGKTYPNALFGIHTKTEAGYGNTKVLALARMGSNLPFPAGLSARASRTARIAAIRRAKSHIRLSQQMLGWTSSFLHLHFSKCPEDQEFIDALCERVANGVSLSIIISDLKAADAAGTQYYGYSVKETYNLIAGGVKRYLPKYSKKELTEHLKQKLVVAPLRIYDRQPGDPEKQSWKWRNEKQAIEPANHAKVYIIDDEAFYIGSDNAYTIALNGIEGLQEFGFLVSGREETRQFIEGYWDKAWRYSMQFAFSD